MTGVRDPLVLLPLPLAATVTTSISDFLHPCESKITAVTVAWSYLNFAGDYMGDFFCKDSGRIRVQRAYHYLYWSAGSRRGGARPK